MYNRLLALVSILTATSHAQNIGTQTKEEQPKLTYQTCTGKGACTDVQGSVVIDGNWRWIHNNASTNCFKGNVWDKNICADNQACTDNCVIEGANYESTYGITSQGNSLSLKFVTKGSYGDNVGSRLYLMAEETKYAMFTLLGNEFSLDVDMSKLPCGLNGAVYFVSMDEDGGMSRFPSNQAGPLRGLGYGDAQCPRDLKFIDGLANAEGWVPSVNDSNSGIGARGSCAPEMDILEANSMSYAFTPHPCQEIKQHSCEGDDCGGTYSKTRYASTCDPDGCDFNPYRLGATDFYGKGKTLDSSKPFTAVTQFIGEGSLKEIRQFYIQDGKKIETPTSKVDGIPGNSITDEFCQAQKQVFGDRDRFTEVGGLETMGQALANPMVLVLSLWDDHASNMLWLDSVYPVGSDPTLPGNSRGECPGSSGSPKDVESQYGDASVVYSNIKFGPIDSTYTVDGA